MELLRLKQFIKDIKQNLDQMQQTINNTSIIISVLCILYIIMISITFLFYTTDYNSVDHFIEVLDEKL